MALKWGICGSGRICQSFVNALQSSPTEEHKVEAVAARSEENARQFADKNKIGKAYGGYQNLAKDADVDVVYVGIVNSEHLSACELMLNNGKHVLCEKPMGLTKGQVKRITDLAKEKNLFCMEAICGRFSPAYSKIRELISTEKIGEVKVVFANYGLSLMHKERILKNELGGGAILDLGIYPIQFALMVFGGKLLFPYQQKVFLQKLVLMILALVVDVMSRPTQLEVTTDGDGKTKVLDFPVAKEAPGIMEGFLRYEADAVKECIKAGKLESPLMSVSDSLVIASIMDKARHDVGYQLEYERANMVMPCQ
ncbi:trans-1,2-dihydrobenzene-1,2-diol dehydrogenase-like [Amphiura filiformis]|uniref:trans-1,2-dihydrobenzene-1,2-diol dehydrogenase-like n=1 Tax=Amphiura filiformis TaxID=82378 RepID=UPI003B2195B9